ncbi:MAG: ABC transporter permease [Lentisphaerae bacterium]|nr:ABC transporter permease [Lentisphaerota bacterium]
MRTHQSTAEAALAVSADGAVVLSLAGEWQLGRPRPAVSQLAWPEGALRLRLDCQALRQWDSSILLYLRPLWEECQRRGIAIDLDDLPPGLRRLLVLATAVTAPLERDDLAEDGFVGRVGEGSRQVLVAALRVCTFVGELCVAVLKLLVGRARMRLGDLITESAKAGYQALFIVSLIGYLIGLILAFIGAIPLKWFGAQIYTASLIGIGMLRLMAAVMVGVVMAGRTAASFAAELGTMQTNEEIDALRCMGVPPMEFLVLPRFLAMTLMMPLLCVYGDILSLAGGLTVGVFYLGFGTVEFWEQLVLTTRLEDLYVGVFTSWIFGMLLGICGCYQGMNCGRDSAAVGRATTAAVVSSIVCMVIATALITVLTVLWKI